MLSDFFFFHQFGHPSGILDWEPCHWVQGSAEGVVVQPLIWQVGVWDQVAYYLDAEGFVTFADHALRCSEEVFHNFPVLTLIGYRLLAHQILRFHDPHDEQPSEQLPIFNRPGLSLGQLALNFTQMLQYPPWWPYHTPAHIGYQLETDVLSH